jgi:hypothetical protein
MISTAIKQLVKIQPQNLTVHEIDLLLALFKALPMFAGKKVAGLVGKFFFDNIFNYELSYNFAEYILNEYITLMKMGVQRDMYHIYRNNSTTS